jgi:hypothetical protein
MPLRVSDNKRFLVDHGKPFFYLGDTGWELYYRLNRDEVRRYLRDRAAKGFNVIHTMGVSEFGQLERPNIEGHLPFIDKDPARPNDAFFDYVDFVLREAESLGLYIGFLPVWGDHVGPLLWGSNPQVLTAGNAAAYGRYLGERFRDRQLIWILGGDRPVETEEQRAAWRALAAGIKETDGDGNHLMSYHPSGWHSTSEWLHEEDWMDFNMIQTSHGSRDAVTYDKVAHDYGLQPVKPTFEAEYCYENHPENWIEDAVRFDDYDVRKGAYWSVFAGGFGFCYGCNDIFPFFTPEAVYEPYLKFFPRRHWTEALAFPGAGQMRHLRALMESRPFLTRIPDQSLLVSDTGTGSDRVQATRDSEGSYAFVYTASGLPVTIDLTKLSGSTLDAWWYDPRTGAPTAIGTMRKDGNATFAPPSHGYGMDWVLVLDDARRGFAAPGAG